MSEPLRDEEFQRAPPVSRRTLIRILILILSLGVGIEILLPQLASLEHSYRVLSTLVTWAVSVAVMAQVLSYIGNGILISELVRIRSGRLSVFWGTIFTLASASLGLVSAGMVGSTTSTYFWIREKGVDSQGALLGSTLPYLFNNALLFFIAIFGLIHLLLLHDITTLQTISFLLLLLFLLLGLGTIGWGVRHPERSVAYAQRAVLWVGSRLHRKFDAPRIGNYIRELIKSWKDIQQGGWLRPALGSLINVGFDILTLYALFLAAAYRIAPEVLITGYGVSLLLGRAAFFIPGGIGVTEASMTALFTGLGVPSSIAVVVTLSYRALSFWFPVVIGFFLLLLMRPQGGNSSQSESD